MDVSIRDVPPHREGPGALMGSEGGASYGALMRQGLDLISATFAARTQPFNGIQPKALQPRLADLSLDQPLAGGLDAALTELDELYLQNTVYYHHPRYLAHLNCPVFVVSLVAELISSALNTAVETWDQSGAATLMEQKVIDWMAKQIGFSPNVDGVFTSGGSHSNLMGLLLAREHRDRDNYAERRHYRILCSEFSHFSVHKAARLLGLGPEAVVAIAGNGQQQLCLKSLQQRLEIMSETEEQPVAIVATAGTTDFGSVDPLPELAALCREHGIWLHVDAAYGGGLLLSDQYRHRLKGIEQADSVTVDFHKTFFQPLCCSGFFVRDRHHLGYLTYHADYLNPEEDEAPNLVDKSLQTSRRFDALKLWLTLRVVGPERIGLHLEQVMALTRHFAEYLRQDPDTELAHDPSLSTIVFRFRAPHLSAAENDRCNRDIRAVLARRGQAVIAGTKVGGRQFLKFTLLNPETPLQTLLDVHYLIKRHGRTLSQLLIQLETTQELSHEG